MGTSGVHHGASSRSSLELHLFQKCSAMPTVALGTSGFRDNWTFRRRRLRDTGAGQNRSISIPDQDRFWVSAGTSYAFNKDDVGVSLHGQKTINEGPYTFNSVGGLAVRCQLQLPLLLTCERSQSARGAFARRLPPA